MTTIPPEPTIDPASAEYIIVNRKFKSVHAKTSARRASYLDCLDLISVGTATSYIVDHSRNGTSPWRLQPGRCS